jgi:Raf kinase inhibitor-like YbhB/YbcL family protein
VPVGRRPRFGVVVAAVLALGVLLAACSDDGTTMREPGTGGATPRAAADDAVFADGEGLFALRSLSFPSDGAIPAQYSRTGGNEIPDLRWRRTPADVAELALVVTDNDADDFVHWIVTGIPPFDDQLPPLANAVEQWPNDFGEAGWTGPDPPPGDEPHSYVFTLHALGDPLDVAPGTPSDEVMLAIEERTVETTLLVGTYAS